MGKSNMLSLNKSPHRISLYTGQGCPGGFVAKIIINFDYSFLMMAHLILWNLKNSERKSEKNERFD